MIVLKRKNKKTVESAIGSMFGDVQTNSAYSNGLSVDHILADEYRATQREAIGQKRFDPCFSVLPRAILSVLVRKNGDGRGNPLVSTRRSIATPHRLMCGFSFGVSRDHGIIAPSFIMGAFRHKFLTGSRTGGFRACRNLVRGISTPYGLPSPWKGRAVLQSAQGALAMMLTLSSSGSTAFSSIPEPVFKPVVSRNNDASVYDVKNDLDAIYLCCENEYRSALRDPSLFHRLTRLNILRGVAVEILRACDETLGRVYTPSNVIGS